MEPIEVAKDLKSKAIDVISVQIMTSQGQQRKALPLLLIKVKITQAKIYGINRCLGIVVRVKKHRERMIPRQCLSFQLYEHS